MAILIAALVGWSRIYLGVHFPLDIVGAMILAFVLVNFYMRSRNILFFKMKQTA
ncbi:phosphatase PAP2 family protein [Acinetobacter ursingii]|uniref:phosphatase PAP2 family protein n=1 Tax=Acinetobacter ursingii TaxID=108980 RepID=UPI003AF84632